MVTITGTISDITGRPDNRPWYAWAGSYQDADVGLVTTRHSRPVFPVAGLLTLELEEDISVVIENPDGRQYFVTTPEVDSDLWDVIGGED